jgi:hypothetical protein
MRTLQLITLALLTTAARADNVSVVTAEATVLSGSSGLPQPVPGCGGVVSGTSLASVAFACTIPGVGGFAGRAVAETGLGPYGIGVNLNVLASGSTVSGDVEAFAASSILWSQDYVIEGAEGMGFVTGQFPGLGSDSFQTARFNDVLWGQFVEAGGFPPGSPFKIPVMFGVPYTLMLSASGECVGFDVNCGSVGAQVTDLKFLDANGNPLSGMGLVPVPEPSALLLLATVVIGLCCWRWGPSLLRRQI